MRYDSQEVLRGCHSSVHGLPRGRGNVVKLLRPHRLWSRYLLSLLLQLTLLLGISWLLRLRHGVRKRHWNLTLRHLGAVCHLVKFGSELLEGWGLRSNVDQIDCFVDQVR